MLQPINSISSLAYILVALVTLIRFKNFRKFPFLLLQLLLVAIGIGSFYYHAKFTLLGQLLDIESMILFVLVWLFIQNTQRSNRHFFWFLLIITVTSIGISIVMPQIRRMIFILLLLFAIIKEIKVQKLTTNNLNKDFVKGTFALLLAGILWTLDINKIFCNPNGVVQLHSIYHVLTGLSAYFLIKYLTEYKDRDLPNLQ